MIYIIPGIFLIIISILCFIRMNSDSWKEFFNKVKEILLIIRDLSIIFIPAIVGLLLIGFGCLHTTAHSYLGFGCLHNPRTQQYQLDILNSPKQQHQLMRRHYHLQ